MKGLGFTLIQKILIQLKLVESPTLVGNAFTVRFYYCFLVSVKGASRRLKDVFQTSPKRLEKREIVTFCYDKTRQLFCDLIRSWLCSTSL